MGKPFRFLKVLNYIAIFRGICAVSVSLMDSIFFLGFDLGTQQNRIIVIFRASPPNEVNKSPYSYKIIPA